MEFDELKSFSKYRNKIELNERFGKRVKKPDVLVLKMKKNIKNVPGCPGKVVGSGAR